MRIFLFYKRVLIDNSLCPKDYKGSGNPISPQILDLIVVFSCSGEQIVCFLRAFHLVVRKKVQKSAPRMELFSVLFRDQDEKLRESRHKSCYGSVLLVDLLTHPPIQKFHHVMKKKIFLLYYKMKCVLQQLCSTTRS